MTREDKIAAFDPDGVGQHNGNLFGMPFTPEEAAVVVLPVQWAATVSYGTGAEMGPPAILEASPQLDFYYPEDPDRWKAGFALAPFPSFAKLQSATRAATEQLIGLLESGKPLDYPLAQELRAQVNAASAQVNEWVRKEAQKWLAQGKTVAVLGGEHSCPLGLMQALASRHPRFGILQIDAHADLRPAYMGLENSHASIMYNALKIPQITELVQVGIRDYCRTEAEVAAASGGRVVMYTDDALKRRRFLGHGWDALCDEIVGLLPQDVYISFDIDGLQPHLCPHTGTPVPGGLDFPEAVHLIRKVRERGKRIIGFDLCEVAPGPTGDWDANVGARVLWNLCLHTQ
jgi:agmatinase